MRLRWTTLAAKDLYRIVQRIQQDNSTAAARVATTVYDGCNNLKIFPNRGRAGRIAGTRELIFSGLPHISSIEDQVVEVLRLYHAAQDWP